MKHSFINYVIWTALSLLVFSCSIGGDVPQQLPPKPSENLNDFILWQGGSRMFTKSAGSDPTLAENQDRITDEVWLTRGNDGGQIFNAFVESTANKGSSPIGTLWAIGEMDDVATVSFEAFRTAVGEPKDVVGKNLLMFIPDEKIVISIQFTAWGQNKDGGFSYLRTTP